MKKIIYAYIVVAIAFLCYLIHGLTLTPQQILPKSGVWYCDELKIQLSFSKRPSHSAVGDTTFWMGDGDCFAIIDGTKVSCYAENLKGSKEVYIGCRNYEDERIYGENIITLHHISLDESDWVLQDETGRQYIFIRIEDES